MSNPVQINSRWASKLQRSVYGHPLASLANVVIALRSSPDWEGVLGFNESTWEVTAMKAPPWPEQVKRDYPARWQDVDDLGTTYWMQMHEIKASRATTTDAIQLVAEDYLFHPIRNHLDSLEWDGSPRLGDYLTVYFNTEPNTYIKTVGRKFLIGAVARIYEPGCKNDCCLVLEGEQGLKKSMALRILAGNDQWFSDDMPDLASKDAKFHSRGFWIIELAELYTLFKADVSQAKAFLSRQRDDVRLPYGKRTTMLPRECVFVGTVNSGQYLHDPTGGRRFWPVDCKGINVESLREDRDQIVAEAVHEYKQWKLGASKEEAPWWFEDEGEVRKEQAERFETNPRQDLIESFLSERSKAVDPTVSQPEIARDCLGLTAGDWGAGVSKDITETLQRCGWKRFQRRTGSKRESRYQLCHA
jgi:predicted P-loop ATPase